MGKKGTHILDARTRVGGSASLVLPIAMSTYRSMKWMTPRLVLADHIAMRLDTPADHALTDLCAVSIEGPVRPAEIGDAGDPTPGLSAQMVLPMRCVATRSDLPGRRSRPNGRGRLIQLQRVSSKFRPARSPATGLRTLEQLE